MCVPFRWLSYYRAMPNIQCTCTLYVCTYFYNVYVWGACMCEWCVCVRVYICTYIRVGMCARVYICTCEDVCGWCAVH